MGLLSALIAAEHGCELTLVDRTFGTGRQGIIHELGASALQLAEFEPKGDQDVVIECAGSTTALELAIDAVGPSGSIGVLGLPSSGPPSMIPPTAIRRLVLGNVVLIGSVNASAADYGGAALLLKTQPPRLLDRFITRTVPAERWTEALVAEPDGIKNVVDLRGAAQ
jgi:glucose 1-dehydrogenase